MMRGCGRVCFRPLLARVAGFRRQIVGLRGAGGCQVGFDEAVVVGVSGELDGLRGGDHDGGEGQELGELVRIADDRLQLGVAEHAA